jgi:hypothetical protein
MLLETNKTLDVANDTLGRARVVTQSQRRVIILTVKEKLTQTTDPKILKESIHSLLDVINELDLKMVSICKGNIAEYTWLEIKTLLHKVLSDVDLNIIICTNKIKIPPEESRKDTITENQCSALGGHKGITKTYHRIKQNY